MLTLDNIKNYGEYIAVEAPHPLRTFSSAMHNPGYGEYKYFINRTVDISYNPLDAHEEMKQFIQTSSYSLHQTVAMMTAVDMKYAFMDFYEDGDTSIVVLVTTGLGNAVDITRSHEYAHPPRVGTINTFIFINGHLTDEALIQGLCGAVEVKTKILSEHDIRDPQSGTIATGTSTDSICIASTQTGERHEFGGSITKLGKLIGKGLYNTMNRSVESFLEYKKGNR